jgi:outer membrane protein assembly factor BamB
LFWAGTFVVAALEMPYFLRFLYALGSTALLFLIYFGWWWSSRRISLGERLYGFLIIIGGSALAANLCDPSIGWFGVATSGLPIVLTIWTLWLFVRNRVAVPGTRLISLVLVGLGLSPLLLIKTNGVNSDLKPDLRWRWTPSAEDIFLAGIPRTGSLEPAAGAEIPLTLAQGDWPEFRGIARDGVARGETIMTDWGAHPPKLLWRQRVGPAWSSVIIVGDYLFTQEQRGEQEAVVCYQSSTGKPLWVHEDTARFSESASGPGPRATPTFNAGRIYALGGTGILNCLDARTGTCKWPCDITRDAASKPPMWGFSSSPLVVRGLVIVYGGGDGQKNLLAYRAESGQLAWTAAAGHMSYSSAQLSSIAGQPQVLQLNDGGLMAVDPANGAKLWEHGLAMPGGPRILQPHVVGESQLLVGSLEGFGVTSVNLAKEKDSWSLHEPWTSKDLKPEFSDFVVHDGHLYGFDGSFFGCIDQATGKRCWKGGRYGRGQVILLADQGLLLVLSETGDVILVQASPLEHHELGRLKAVEGKTWNHPVVAHGRLYVRNAEEMACYELQQAAIGK